MSSGISRISWITVPAFCNRLFSSFALSSAAFPANDRGASISAPAKTAAIRFINIPSMLSSRLVLFVLMQALIPPLARRHDNDPRYQSHGAKNRRKKNGVMFFLRGLYGTDVHDLLLCCVGEALIRQREKTDDDQCYSQDCSSVHRSSPLASRNRSPWIGEKESTRAVLSTPAQ